MSEAEITSSNILARDVSFETYMQEYAEYHAEWVEGMVIKLSPVRREHDLLTQFFRHILRIYLSRTKAGLLMTDPFVMRASSDSPARQPDLHLVLAERADIVTDTYTDGPADIVIEVVSSESSSRDRGEKFDEYELGGVREYWLIDPLRKIPYFYSLGDDGRYKLVELKNGVFHSTVLPKFSLPVAVLWQEDVLEDDEEIRALVDAMFED